MKLIDNYPNAERTLTTIEASLITKKEYQKLKSISKRIKDSIETELESDLSSYGMVKYHVERTIRSSKNALISKNAEKEIIIANILLPDDIQIAELLNKNNFTIEHLKAMIRFRSSLKNLILNSAPIDEETQRKLEIYKRFVTTLIELFKAEFNVDDQTIILNRICEMLVTCPNYFETKRTEYTRKK